MTQPTSTQSWVGRHEAKDARYSVRWCWIGGLGLLVVGAGIAWAALTSGTEPAVMEEGGAGGVLAGLAVSALGQILLLVAIIATGVRLGVDSASRRTEV